MLFRVAAIMLVLAQGIASCRAATASPLLPIRHECFLSDRKKITLETAGENCWKYEAVKSPRQAKTGGAVRTRTRLPRSD